ncbi:DMT family transporter [Paractinoplanes rhizophilus]|jgi:drug/metabolite transporter (DMT)-like permease|uniref:DMT family transporter n=1 Tax=Paractinoplanes rhizophilus TaxID=1416877 RepID=A0ABW2HU11_9ACTN|nr:DMT family transporter [Actinoplanes sp.]
MKSLQIDRTGAVFIGVWSSGYIGGSLATSAIAPLAANLWRFAIGGLLLAGIARRRREAWPRGRGLAAAALVGALLFAVQFGGLYLGMANGTPAATTALIACSAPLLVAAVGAVLGWDRLAGRQWIGIALGVAGVAVTLADRLGRPPTETAFAWTLLGLAGLTSGTLLQGRLRTGAGPAALAATEVAFATLAMAAWAPLEGSLAIPGTPRAIGSLLWIALIPGVAGPLLFFALIKQRGATRASSLLFVVPAATAIAAWPILGTPIGLTTVAGLIVAAVGLRLTLASPDRPRPGLEPVIPSDARPADPARDERPVVLVPQPDRREAA